MRIKRRSFIRLIYQTRLKKTALTKAISTQMRISLTKWCHRQPKLMSREAILEDVPLSLKIPNLRTSPRRESSQFNLKSNSSRSQKGRELVKTYKYKTKSTFKRSTLISLSSLLTRETLSLPLNLLCQTTKANHK